jgi:flagellar basal body-associated protein FliL
MNKKRNIWFWIILIILLIVIAVGIYVYYSGGTGILPTGIGGSSIPQPPALPD